MDGGSFLVDGDNLIGHWGGPRAGEDRRAEVVRRVQALCARRGTRAVVVFDPTASVVAAAAPVEVRVAADGETADDVIRDLVDAAAGVRELIVVTSDKPLYSYARTRGASVVRAHEWTRLERE
jgi:predicted RNA-binding protein with PIN domain